MAVLIVFVLLLQGGFLDQSNLSVQERSLMTAIAYTHQKFEVCAITLQL